jgi:hypothetical protein
MRRRASLSATNCLKLFEASSYGSVCEDQEDRRGELDRWSSDSTARIEFLVTTSEAETYLQLVSLPQSSSFLNSSGR